VTLETLIYDFGKDLALWIRGAYPISARIFANDLESVTSMMISFLVDLAAQVKYRLR
jgi:hypothetical protein